MLQAVTLHLINHQPTVVIKMTHETDVLQSITECLLVLSRKDSELDRERAEHRVEIRQMNAAIKQLTASNEQVNKAIIELLGKTEQGKLQMEMLHELVDSRTRETQSRVDLLTKRVDEIEEARLIEMGERKAVADRKKWWGDNWHKIFTTIVILVPLIIGIGKLLDK